MDEQNKNNLQPTGITPPNPDNELTAGTPAPTASPAPAAASTSTEKVLEDKLAEAEKQATSSPVVPRPVKKQKRWIAWLIIILLIIGGAAAWYFLKYSPEQQTYIPEQVADQRSAALTYRSSTFPTGTLTVDSGTNSVDRIATITTRMLNPLPEGTYALVLAKFGKEPISNKVISSSDTSVAKRIDNFSIDAQGKVITEKNKDATFAAGYIDFYDTALIMIDNGTNASIVMEGKLYQDEREPGTTKATLAFPIDFSTLNGSVNIKTLEGIDNNSLAIAFNELPDIANLGYTYEAHLVQFEGPYVKQDKAIGRFPGNKVGVDINLNPKVTLSNFTNLVISLEPTWDNDKDIAQMKPFIAEL